MMQKKDRKRLEISMGEKREIESDNGKPNRQRKMQKRGKVPTVTHTNLQTH